MATKKATDNPNAVTSYPTTPDKLAAEIMGPDNRTSGAKRIRGFLRERFTRPIDAKNSSWTLDEETANVVREKFARSAAKADDANDA